MNNAPSYIYYSSLISRYLSNDLSESEAKELESWKSESDDNLLLYNKILDKENRYAYKRNVEEIDYIYALQKIKTTGNTMLAKRILFRKFMKYAAIFIIVLATSATMYYLTLDEKMSIEGMGTEEIVIGSPKAMLVLGDGSKHRLSVNENTVIQELGGRKIKKLNTTINYQDSSIIHGKEEIVYNHMITPRGGGDYSVILSDGSKIFANSLSNIKYPVKFIGDKRIVEVLEGEAFFEVAENQEKSFIVKTNGAELEVLGTSFNVSCYKDARESIFTLETGSLQITNLSDKNEVIVLKPNQQARIDNKNPDKIEISEVDASIYSAWKKGRFVFKDERLDVIMQTLSRWYNIEVFYEYESLKSLRFGGSLYKYSELNSLLNFIELTEKVKIEMDKNYILITKNN